jgi:hypothetical protein
VRYLFASKTGHWGICCRSPAPLVPTVRSHASESPLPAPLGRHGDAVSQALGALQAEQVGRTGRTEDSIEQLGHSSNSWVVSVVAFRRIRVPTRDSSGPFDLRLRGWRGRARTSNLLIQSRFRALLNDGGRCWIVPLSRALVEPTCRCVLLVTGVFWSVD